MILETIIFLQSVISSILEKRNVENNAYLLLQKFKKKLFLKTVFHGFCCLHCLFAHLFGLFMLKSCNNHAIDKIDELYTYSWGMGTNWNFTFQTIFLCLALFHDVLEWSGRADGTLGSKVRYWRDVIFGGLVFPVTMFVFSMFWSLYLIDRELVFPTVFDEVVPWWFNHSVHTNIFIIIAVETVLQPRRRPTNLFMETVFYAAVSVGYAIVFYSIYFFAHRWLYYVFGVFTWWQVCLFQLLIWTSTHIFYKIQYPINRLIHGSSDPNECIEDTNGKTLSGEYNNVNFTDNSKEISRNKEGTHNNGFTKDAEVVNGRKESNRTENVLIKHNRVGDSNDNLKKEVKYKEDSQEDTLKDNGFNNINAIRKVDMIDKSWSLKYRTRNEIEYTDL